MLFTLSHSSSSVTFKVCARVCVRFASQVFGLAGAALQPPRPHTPFFFFNVHGNEKACCCLQFMSWDKIY